MDLVPATLSLLSDGNLLDGGNGGLDVGVDGSLLVGSALVGSLLHLLQLLRVAVEEEIDGDLPGGSARDGAAHAEHLSGEQPEEQADGQATLVVAGDREVDVLQGRVGVGEGNDGDVGVGSLLDGLGVDSGVGDDDQAGLSELLRDLVGEGTRGEAASNALRTGVVRVLEHGALAVGSGGDHHDVLRVLDGGDDAGSHHELLPGLAEVHDVHAVLSSLPDVLLHLEVRVQGADVDIGSQHLLDVILLGLQNSPETFPFKKSLTSTVFINIAFTCFGVNFEFVSRIKPATPAT